jgi:integrase
MSVGFPSISNDEPSSKLACVFTSGSPKTTAGLVLSCSVSHVAMAKVLRRTQIEDATVHGFRSAFRDWAGNETHFAREIAEAALAHVVGDKAEQAYRRLDALDKRRTLMEAWANYCEPKAGSNIVTMAKEKRAAEL